MLTPFLLAWELKDRGYAVSPTNCVRISQWLPRLSEHRSHLEEGRASETQEFSSPEILREQTLGTASVLEFVKEPQVILMSGVLGTHCPKLIL